MSNFKSPQLHICGRIKQIIDLVSTQQSSIYVKMHFIQGEGWKMMSGNPKFQTFQTQSNYGVASVQHPFNIHYISNNIRGWPRIMLQVWKVNSYGRHNLYGYGTVLVPMSSNDYTLQIYCWRPKGTWYDNIIDANSQLQYSGIVASSLSRYGLRTISSCKAVLEVNVIGRNFHVHGVVRN